MSRPKPDYQREVMTLRVRPGLAGEIRRYAEAQNLTLTNALAKLLWLGLARIEEDERCER